MKRVAPTHDRDFLREILGCEKASHLSAESPFVEGRLLHLQRLAGLGTATTRIVHELRNVLLPLTGYANLVRLELQPTHPAQAFVREILKTDRRANDLIQQILDYSRCREANLEQANLAHAVADGVKLLRSTLPASVRIETRLPDGLPSAPVDVTQIHQIVFNLGINAWQAMESGPGNISIELTDITLDSDVAKISPDLTAGRYLQLSFRDDGKGMDDAMLDHIFEPYFTTKPAGEGTGLGLSVVLEIMKNHKGAITAQSASGRGAIFQLYFPVPGNAQNSPPIQ